MTSEMAPELPSESSEAPAKQAPIIFRLPHKTPDVRLVVFDQEYHVHSTILKLYSNYFRKFLDSPDKPGSSPSSLFKYEYVTVVDDDGIWALESAHKVQAIKPDALALLESSGKISVKSECAIFRKLMSAMYHRPYTIDSASDILELTRVADFYCALPIVSATLSGSLISSEYFAKKHFIKGKDNPDFVWYRAPELLLAAYRLRHAILFRECLIHTVDFLDASRRLSRDDRYKSYHLLDQNDVLYRIVLEHHNLKCQKIMKVNMEQIKLAQDPKVSFLPSAETLEIIETERPDMNAKYFRAVRQELAAQKLGGPEKPLMKALDDLLKSNLVLDKTGRSPGEDGIYECSFQACDADKVVLPWNEDEIDW
ncbi:hypothetical protein HYFRA_00008739 [Hymenoscyphus fraxineus]|uniref:BTB domain-containing protein n=1 Tax=Hymenoscyphus fraxineus TaxID=746836 RepID=A0A9N9KXX1_9HELO|nr:hypothetical protein HYFRA_00008739 [Hymenoscyphus fraxineus]